MPTDLQTILQLKVPVIVQIAKTRLTMDDVLTLGPGAILELNRSAEDDLDLLVNNMPIASGQAVKVGENFGLKITRVDTPRERVQAMAGQ